mgnify:FL=1
MARKDKFIRDGVEYSSKREYYNAVERGEAKDDKCNPFLLHFGFNYWGDRDGVEAYEMRKYHMRTQSPKIARGGSNE